MNNLRERLPYLTPELKIWRNHRGSANAVMRAFGNSIYFPWSHCTRDFGLAGSLQDCSLLYLYVEDDAIIDVINSFTPQELIFSRMTGETSRVNPFACLISKHDVMAAYQNYVNQRAS